MRIDFYPHQDYNNKKDCSKNYVYIAKGVYQMKKRLVKAAAAVFSMCLSFNISFLNANAVYETCSHGNRTFNDKQLSGGVGNYGNYKRYYWFSSSFSHYSSYATTAMDRWIYTTDNPGVTTSISWRNTTTQSSGSIELYEQNLSGDTTGITEFWYYSTELSDWSTQNWGWNKILIDYNDTSSYTYSKKLGLIEHEMGHAFGLAHQPYNTASIMYPYDDERSGSRPATVDCQNINHIYG